MKIHECRVQHTYTHDGVEEAQRHVSVQVTASLDPGDSWLFLADYIRDVLVMGALEPKDHQAAAARYDDKKAVTDIPPMKVPGVVTSADTGKFGCPHCDRHFKNLSGVEIHIGKKHPEVKDARA